MRKLWKRWRQRARHESLVRKAGEVPFFYSIQVKYVLTYLLLVVAGETASSADAAVKAVFP